MNYFSTFFSLLCAVVILVRCVCVLDHMDYRVEGRPYLSFLAFGLSYVALAGAALASMFQVWENHADLSHWLFLMASAGLIAFDRRTRNSCPQSHG